MTQPEQPSYESTFGISHGLFQLTDERVVPELAEPAIRTGDLVIPQVAGCAPAPALAGAPLE